MARAHQEVDAEEQRQQEIKANLKAVLEGKKAKRDELASVVASGAEYRSIDVVLVFDYIEGTVTETRTDTGEQIGRRRMTEDERQMSLPQ